MDLEDATSDEKSGNGGSACKVIFTCIWDIHFAFSEILLLFIRLVFHFRNTRRTGTLSQKLKKQAVPLVSAVFVSF